MIIKPELLTPDDPLAEYRGSFARLPKDQLRAIARKGGQATARSPKRHKFTYSETHRGGVIRGAQKTMQARSR